MKMANIFDAGKSDLKFANLTQNSFLFIYRHIVTWNWTIIRVAVDIWKQKFEHFQVNKISIVLEYIFMKIDGTLNQIIFLQSFLVDSFRGQISFNFKLSSISNLILNELLSIFFVFFLPSFQFSIQIWNV